MIRTRPSTDGDTATANTADRPMTPGRRGMPLRRAGTAGLVAALVGLAACGPQNGAPVAQQTTAQPLAQTAVAQQGVQEQPSTQQPMQPQPVPQQPVQQPVPMAPQAVAPQPQPVPQQQAVARADLGQVSSIEPIVSAPSSTGAGAVIGGVLGGVLGHQVGGGTGKKVATVAGAVGGAFAGNAVERSRSEKITGYRVHVQLDNGRSRSFTERDAQAFRVGDRVRIVNGSIVPA